MAVQMSREMWLLHRAAMRRAYRTFAQAMGGNVTVSLGVALVESAGGGDIQQAGTAFLVGIGGAVVAAGASFWQGIAAGLPEAPKPPRD